MSIGTKIVMGAIILYLVSGLFDTMSGLTRSVTVVSSVLYLLCIAAGLTGGVLFLVSKRAQLFRRCALAALLLPAYVYVTPEFSLVFPSPISLTLASTGCITRQESVQESVVAYMHKFSFIIGKELVRITRQGSVVAYKQEGVELVPLILLSAAWAVSKDYVLLERRRRKQPILQDPRYHHLFFWAPFLLLNSWL